ncbi:MAG: SMP-30/gluconolactonase/LRE family protein [Lautropia sp.]
MSAALPPTSPPVVAGAAVGQRFEFQPSQRYPDPAVRVLDPAFGRYRIFSASVEQLASGLRWAEGPVWFGDGRYLLLSDIPNDRILRWDEATGLTTVFRQPSNFANGLVRDRQGRLLACEHGGRRVTRTEYDGTITVLADRYDGKRLNSPNDIVCASDGSIWFSDPVFGISGHYEGDRAESEVPQAVYRIDGNTGKLARMNDELAGPNGLCFSPDEKTLYVVESRAVPNRLIWAFDVGRNGKLGKKRLHADADGEGAFDGIRADVDGNLWCGFGATGSSKTDPAELDGVVVFDPNGKRIGQIHLPERCANLCFGGRRNNRLFMASSHSLYALYVDARGAV